jgi:hypothetical protein
MSGIFWKYYSSVAGKRGDITLLLESYFMVKHTDRDAVWCFAMRAAINHAANEEDFAAIEVKDVRWNFDGRPDGAPSDRIIRDVLNTMAEQGWLFKVPQSQTWESGPALHYVQFEEPTTNEVAYCDCSCIR